MNAIQICQAVLVLGIAGVCGNGCSPVESASASAHVGPGPLCVVGLSPYLEDQDKDEVYRRVVHLLLERLPLNSSLQIFDAYHLRSVTRVDIPNIAAFRSGKTRANQFKREIHALKEFLATRPERQATPDLDRAVRFPQFLRFVGENLRQAGRPLTVLVLGSPLYLDAKEPGFSMVQGYFPSDGHLCASQEQSIFGIKNLPDALRDVRVHYGYFGDPWISEIHHEKVDRFWTLFLQGQGGSLERFCGDLPTLFGSILAGETFEPRVSSHQLDTGNPKIEMLRITRDVGQTDWISSDSPSNVRSRPPAVEIGPLKIGIRWEGEIDLDLYCRPRREAKTLSFQQTNSPEGYYFRDHRSSPLREYEFIEFETAVDVREVEAAVNFYEGVVPDGPTGEVRIEFDGGIYVGQFSIDGERGNRARSGRDQNACWREIDVLGILRMR